MKIIIAEKQYFLKGRETLYLLRNLNSMKHIVAVRMLYGIS